MTGSGRLVIPVGCSLTIDGPSAKDLAGWTVDLAGSALWEGTGSIRSGYQAIIEIQKTGVLEIASDEAVYHTFGGSPPALNNAGVVRKRAGNGTTTFNGSFNNSSTLEIQSGTISLRNGGMNIGRFSIFAGATLDLSGGTHNFNTGSSIDGKGALVLWTGSAKVNGTVSIAANVAISGGTLEFAGDVNSTGEIDFSSGALTGSGVLTCNGVFDWTGGTLGGGGSLVIPAGGGW